MLFNSQKFLFISLGCCLVIWTVGALFFWRIYEKREIVDNMTRQNLSISSQKDEIQFLTREIESLNDNIKELDNFIVGASQEEIVNFIELVESLSPDSGLSVTISSVDVSSVGEEALDENYEMLNLELEVVGRWHSVFHFLSLLESLPFKAVIHKVSLTSGARLSEGEDSHWQGNFILEVAKFK